MEMHICAAKSATNIIRERMVTTEWHNERIKPENLSSPGEGGGSG